MAFRLNPFAAVLRRLSSEVRLSVGAALGGAVSGLATVLVGIEARLRCDIAKAEDRLKAHTEHAVEETRALVLREIRAELDARLPVAGTALARTDLPTPDGPGVPRGRWQPGPARGLPAGRPHP